MVRYTLRPDPAALHSISAAITSFSSWLTVKVLPEPVCP